MIRGQDISTLDHNLLEHAATKLRALRSVHSVEWTPHGSIERPRSTLHVLRASHERGSELVYYKTEHWDIAAHSPASRLERRLQVERSLDRETRDLDRLTAFLEPHGIVVPTLLAADVASGTSIRTHVHGRARSPVKLRWIGPPRLLQRVGRSVAHFDLAGMHDGPPLGKDQVEQRVFELLHRNALHIGAHRIRSLEERINELLAQIDPATCSTWGHGDISPTNLFVDHSHVGFIDLSLSPQPTGRDLAQFIARVETGRVSTNRNRGFLVGGYLAVLPGAEMPLRLALTERAIRLAERPHRATRRWAHANLDQIISDTVE